MKLVYILAKAIFFPGTFMKGFFEHIVCRMTDVRIYDADHYITKNQLSGHVSMLPADTAGKSFGVCFLPGVFNFLIGFPALMTGILTLGFMGVDVIDPLSGAFCPMFLVYCLLFLFGCSFMCSLFPYTEDAQHMWKMIYGEESHASMALKIFAFLPACIMMAGSYLEKYSVTFLASIGILVYWILL